ncbi:MAG: Cytochrome-c oxidase [bacterium]|nr:Cytochrome-c oxidase [bacterium]
MNGSVSPATSPADEAALSERERESRFWETLHGWIVTVDHKRLGVMYVLYALVFLVVGGTEASLMRWQLAAPHKTLLAPDAFNRLFTLHGTTMVFFFGMPLIFGFGNYLVPLMVGARDMAFPRLNAFSFWMSAFAGLLLYFSYIGAEGLWGDGSAPAVGWFAYAPLTERAFSRGHSTDYWILAIFLSGIGSIGTAINLITTIVSRRCRGMTLGKMPLLVWFYLVDSGLVLTAVPPLSAAQLMLLADRYFGAHFFDTQAGGSAVLWQHFFWIFGHPEVYILMIPAWAFVSEIIPVFSRKAIFGYPVLVGAVIAIGFVSVSVWAHHMFAVGMSTAANTFFMISTLTVGIPTGIKLFNWIGTMWGGKIRLFTPMLFCVAFISQFLIAGLTGIMLAAVPFNWQLTDSYFVVAHFHYMLVGALVFAAFGAFYYWIPKVTGRMLDEKLGKLHFWLFVIGFHLTFDTMHIPGLLGMPRRIYTYEPDRGWNTLNLVISVGVVFQVAAVACFLFNLVRSLRKGERAGADPWDAWTLEWSTASPPPEYNFAVEPTVRSRRPLWDLKHPEDPDWVNE